MTLWFWLYVIVGIGIAVGVIDAQKVQKPVLSGVLVAGVSMAVFWPMVIGYLVANRLARP